MIPAGVIEAMTATVVLTPMTYSFPTSVDIAIDTEFVGPHTLLIQTACRLDENTLAVQLYRSPAIPGLPDDFRPENYLQSRSSAYGKHFDRVCLRPVQMITGDLSPGKVLADLLGLPIHPLTRQQGMRNLIVDGIALTPSASIRITFVGHFLTADFLRIFGRTFYASVLSPHPDVGLPALTVGSHRLLQYQLVRGRGIDCQPVLEYAEFPNRSLAELRVGFADTMLPFGKGSLDYRTKAFLGVGKIDDLTVDDKANMLATFAQRPGNSYGYAIVDVVNTLLLHEQFQARDHEIQLGLGILQENVSLLQPTLGRRVSESIVTLAEQLAVNSQALKSDRKVKELMRKGGQHQFEADPRMSRYGIQTGQPHGGLLFSRSPTKFSHLAPGMLRDVDLASCYNAVSSRIDVYLGRPVIYEPGENHVSLAEAIEFLNDCCNPDAWYLRVTGEIPSSVNTLIPSTRVALTSQNYSPSRAKSHRTRAMHTLDGTVGQQRQGAKLLSWQIDAGVVTYHTWLAIGLLPQSLRTEYASLQVDSMVFYPRQLVATTGGEFDHLKAILVTGRPSWRSTLDLHGLRIVTEDFINDDFVSLRFPLHEYAQKLAENRERAQAEYGKGSAQDESIKVHANTTYGVLASPYLPTCNVVAANQITACARAAAFAMIQSLNGIQVITDGVTYRLDQIPAVTFRECLERKPDYPIRRAEDGDGIPFLDPLAIPAKDDTFTVWYRQHVQRFFEISDQEIHGLFRIHDLAHKKTERTGSVAFDGLITFGAGDYVKLTRDQNGEWHEDGTALRSYGRDAKAVVVPWLIGNLTNDSVSDLPPIAMQRKLLKFKDADRQARSLLRDLSEVIVPLGLESCETRNLRLIKPSGFVFQNEAQLKAFEKLAERFKLQTGCGLELLALRQGADQGDLEAFAERIYGMIQEGERRFAHQGDCTLTYAPHRTWAR